MEVGNYEKMLKRASEGTIVYKEAEKHCPK